MANTSVFNGAHGTLTLALVDSKEGKEGESIISAYAVQTVGRVTEVQVCVETDLDAFYEIGNHYAQSLHRGRIKVSGKIGRAYINGALLGLLLGRKSFLPDTAPDKDIPPEFNMNLRLDDPAVVGNAQLSVNRVKLENWSYNLPENDFVLEQVTFKAISMEIIDIEDTVTIGPVFVD